MIDLRKGGGLHALLGRLTAEAALVLGLAELTLLGVDRDEKERMKDVCSSIPVHPPENR